MLHGVELVQNQSLNARLMFFRVDESAVSAVTAGRDGLLEGSYLADIFKNGTGDYTLTLKRTAARAPVVVGACAIGLVDARFAITELDENTIRIVWEVGGTDTNADFHLTVAVFGDQTQR